MNRWLVGSGIPRRTSCASCAGLTNSQALQRFCDGKVGLSYVPPGSPWDNGDIESFNNRLRKECLNRNQWTTLFEARVVIGDFKHEHNHRHSALGYRTPAEYAAASRHTHTPVARQIY
jgi:putative transposase